MKEQLRYTLGALALGQLISLCGSGGSFASSELAYKGVDAPVTQLLLVYTLVALAYGGVFLYRGQKLQVPWYWYTLLAFVDLQGSYLNVKAYQYTSITSVTLLSCWAIPWVMILTRFFMKTRYTIWQFIGAAICIIGLVLTIFSDVTASDSGGSKPILGDALVIVGAIFSSTSNVFVEFCVKKRDRVEAFAMLGVFGSLISAIQLVVLERKVLESLDWSYTIILLFLGYGLSVFCLVVLMSFLLKMSGATHLNLSLLTLGMWAVLIRTFFYHDAVDWLYYVSFGIVVAGLTIYSLYDDTDKAIPDNVNEIDSLESIPYTQLDPERAIET